MDNEQPSSIQSICHIRASELFPKRPLEREDKHLQIPFKTICGEAVEYLGRTANGVLALSNYRIYQQLEDTYHNIPLGLVETIIIDTRDNTELHIGCKDARSFRYLIWFFYIVNFFLLFLMLFELFFIFFRCKFSTNEHCQDWFRRLSRVTSPPKQIEDVFAFAFHAWASEEGGEEVLTRLASKDSEHYYFRSEVRFKSLKMRPSPFTFGYNNCDGLRNESLLKITGA